MGFMDMIVKSIKREKREEMMVNMMPLMMEGIDINQLMPKMMTAMCKDVTSEDVTQYFKKTLGDKEGLKAMGAKMLETNPMVKMMMKRYRSVLGFTDTVGALTERIPQHNWSIPDTRDLQRLWTEAGVKNAPRIKVLYLCNARGGYEITKDDDMMAMSVMMPMGLSVYELSTGEIELAHMDLGIMAGMFTGKVKEVLQTSARNLANALDGIVE